MSPALSVTPRSVPRLFSLAKGVSGEAEIRKRHNATFVLPALGFPQTGNEVMQACWGRERRRGAEVLRHDGVVVILTSLHSMRRAGGARGARGVVMTALAGDKDVLILR